MRTPSAAGHDYPGPIDDPQSLWLGLDYFGYSQNPGSNFVIGTLNDGKRDYQGLDLIFRKRYSDNWQLLGSYTYNWAKGNTNSDSNADFQGDVLYLDPLAPNSYARQPGTVPHIFKVAGSYMFPVGVEFGAAYRWNSGTMASRTAFDSNRNLPIQVDTPFVYAGINERWLAPDAVGSLENPSWGQLDLRAQYKRRFNGGFGAEFFVDIFNVFNNQDSIRNQDLVAGSGSIAFGQPDPLQRSAAVLPRGAFDVLAEIRKEDEQDLGGRKAPLFLLQYFDGSRAQARRDDSAGRLVRDGRRRAPAS